MFDSHCAFMGLLLLRATTTTLAWIPAARLNSRPVAKYGCFSQFLRHAPSYGGSSSSSQNRINSRLPCVSSPFSTFSRGGQNPEEAIPAALVEVEKSSAEEEAAGEEGEEGGSSSSKNVQPVLEKHMAMLEIKRRKGMKSRQHVNPLAATYLQPVVLLEGWLESAFRNSFAPLLVDIGCAKGAFLTSMAKANPDRNYLGLEIRRPTAAVALTRSAELETGNCHLVCCNVNVDLDRILTEAGRNGASVDTICIQFPDPHFKTRHYKRRIVQPELVTCIEKHLRPGGTLFMQSDVLEVMKDMRTITRETAEMLEDSRPDMKDWMEGPDNNPFGVQTEREKVTYEKETPDNRVYRCVFVKKA